MPSPLSKRIAGRVTGACGHTVPVLVPCIECVEKQLDSWEQRIRDEAMKALTDDMKNGRADVIRWKAELDRIKRDDEALVLKVADLKKSNEDLRGRLISAKREIDDMRAQLHATQAVVQGSQLRMVKE